MDIEHENDVQIGANEWIAFIPHEDSDPKLDIMIDEQLLKAESLWGALETECDAGCCGIKAFNFLPENIQAIRGQIDVATALNAIRVMKSRISESTGTVVCSKRLNHHCIKESFLRLLEHLRRNLETSN